MNPSRLALAVFTAGRLCACDAVGQDEKKAESDAFVVRFDKTLAEAKAKDNNGKTAVGYAKDNEDIYKTKVDWKLNDLKYE